MSLLARLSFCLLLSLAVAPPVVAREATPVTAATQLVPFASPEGMARLARADGRADFPALANQFEAQANIAFCGPTSATIVLNALFARSGELPHDRSRLQAGDLNHFPGNFDLTVPRFTQESVVARGPKPRARIFGEPFARDGRMVRDGGYQLRQFDALLRANGASTRLVVVDDRMAAADIRRDLIANLQTAGDYVVVNYRRELVGQPGGGHISPLAAYDADSDSVLVLDVNPAVSGWVWMPIDVLIRGMRSFDTEENRGYVLVGR